MHDALPQVSAPAADPTAAPPFAYDLKSLQIFDGEVSYEDATLDPPMRLPINGIETGTTNIDSFTEVAFAFRVTPSVLVTSVVFSLFLGLFGGALPAWRAARMPPAEALGRH